MQELLKLKEYLKKEEQAFFQGWDFSYLDGRIKSEALAWDYRALVNQYRTPGQQLLDMHTGGGEFLMSLGHPHERTCVIEGWEPNLRLCRQRLAPLGITVKAAGDNNQIDYEDEQFDLVINRHGDFLPVEIVRVLKPGGIFITQQVGCKNNRVLIRKLMGELACPCPDHDLQHNTAMLNQAGMQILWQKEMMAEMSFYDLGAVVFLARQLPWEFPGFSVDTHFHAVAALGDELTESGVIWNQAHRFVIAARKI